MVPPLPKATCTAGRGTGQGCGLGLRGEDEGPQWPLDSLRQPVAGACSLWMRSSGWPSVLRLTPGQSRGGRVETGS